MKTETIFLSSENISQTTIFSTLSLSDYTTVKCNVSGVSENLLPSYLKIDWGDGYSDFYENNIFQTENLISNRFSSIFFDEYTHEYFPSDTTTSKTLTASLTIKYINNDSSIFNIPIIITNYDYLSAIEDITLINSTISPNNKEGKTHQFITKKGGYLIELKTPQPFKS